MKISNVKKLNLKTDPKSNFRGLKTILKLFLEFRCFKTGKSTIHLEFKTVEKSKIEL